MYTIEYSRFFTIKWFSMKISCNFVIRDNKIVSFHNKWEQNRFFPSQRDAFSTWKESLMAYIRREWNNLVHFDTWEKFKKVDIRDNFKGSAKANVDAGLEKCVKNNEYMCICLATSLRFPNLNIFWTFLIQEKGLKKAMNFFKKNLKFQII